MEENAAKPLTYAWLLTHGFRTVIVERTAYPHVRRALAADKVGGRLPFESADDLCLELSLGGAAEAVDWYCWLLQAEPRRHIHIRYLRYRQEVVQLYEALTGAKWQEQP